MNLTYIAKAAFNVIGITIHSSLAINLNKIFNELKALNDENHDSLLKYNDQLHLLIINEISLVDNKMLSFIDDRLRIIKHIHNQLMGGLNVIMSSDFYHVPPI
jgi:DNA replication protein DnaC